VEGGSFLKGRDEMRRFGNDAERTEEYVQDFENKKKKSHEMVKE
jgi:hypothetical protein